MSGRISYICRAVRLNSSRAAMFGSFRRDEMVFANVNNMFD